MRCPRCARDSKDGTVYCPGCGAPLALRAEPPPRVLDVPLAIDRRSRRASPDPEADPAATRPLARADLPGSPGSPALLPVSEDPLPVGAPRTAASAPLQARLPGPVVAHDRSSWDLGPALRASADDRLTLGAPPRRASDETFSAGAPLRHAADETFSPGAPLRHAAGGALAPEPPPPPAREDPFSWERPPTAALEARHPRAAPAAARLAEVARRPAADPAPGAVAAGAPEVRPAALGVDPASTADAEGWFDEELPDVEVERVEIHLRRPASWRRAASWGVDAAPFAVLLAAVVESVFAGLPGGAARGLWPAGEQALRDPALTLQIVAGVVILWIVYQTLAHALAGATLGKWLLGLRVVGPDGRRPGFGRSGARALLALGSLALLGLGPLLALFTESGRALHDLAGRTWVVEAP